ncbi:MAG: hypothetical protein J3Q66DRAFT_343906, partial [Benniella sp.]
MSILLLSVVADAGAESDSGAGVGVGIGTVRGLTTTPFVGPIAAAAAAAAAASASAFIAIRTSFGIKSLSFNSLTLFSHFFPYFLFVSSCSLPRLWDEGSESW